MLISSDQFDVIVKVVNSALIDEKVAMMLLPLTTIIYRVSVVAMETEGKGVIAMEAYSSTFGNGRTHSWN